VGVGMWEIKREKLKEKGEVKRKKGKPKPLKAVLFPLKS
jgi:P2-related tail formation protein